LSTVYLRFAARSSIIPQRAPVLERLIARASPAAHVMDWRTEAFHAIAATGTPVPPLAAAALHASAGVATGTWVCVATPVHLVAGMSSVTLPDDGILELNEGEAETLAADFNQVFGDAGVRLAVGRAATLLCVFDQALEVATRDPEDVRGGDVFACQPTGRNAARLRQLMSEMEMWLFEHEVNRARASRALSSITGLWLWGGGTMLALMPTVHGWTAGSDPLFTAFRVEEDFPSEAGAGVVVCADQPGSSGWSDLERRWLEPAMAALRLGRLDRIELSAGDRRFSVRKGINWRFWRRPRPWWQSFGMEGESNGIQ
jgi:hypothetical protein